MRLSVSGLGLGKAARYQPLCSLTEDDNEPLLDATATKTQTAAAGEMHMMKSKNISTGTTSEETLKLVILKLDGTSFDVCVGGGASVREMKAALEKTVNQLEIEMLGYCDIQWDQVWGNFCLCYMNQKLLDDGALLRAFGIHNDDQLEFVRHASTNNERKK